MDQKQQLEELFDRWRNKPNHDETFIADGIVNLPKWISQNNRFLVNPLPKVLFFLKEAYGGSFDLAAALDKAGADFGRSQIWWRIAIWTQAIRNNRP